MSTVFILDPLEWLFPDGSYLNCRYKLRKNEERIFTENTSLWLFKISGKEDYSSNLLCFIFQWLDQSISIFFPLEVDMTTFDDDKDSKNGNNLINNVELKTRFWGISPRRRGLEAVFQRYRRRHVTREGHHGNIMELNTDKVETLKILKNRSEAQLPLW